MTYVLTMPGPTKIRAVLHKYKTQNSRKRKNKYRLRNLAKIKSSKDLAPTKGALDVALGSAVLTDANTSAGPP